jgi:hypothetical protein
MKDREQIVEALRLIRAGQWEAAHEIVQRRSDPAACRVHGLLHRIEGDIGNAGYWYRRAGEPVPLVEPERELEELLSEFGS